MKNKRQGAIAIGQQRTELEDRAFAAIIPIGGSHEEAVSIIKKNLSNPMMISSWHKATPDIFNSMIMSLYTP